MCQIIRDYEFQVLELQNKEKESSVTLESRIKILSTENKSLKAENKKLLKKISQCNSDCERLSEEYKVLIEEINSNKVRLPFLPRDFTDISRLKTRNKCLKPIRRNL